MTPQPPQKILLPVILLGLLGLSFLANALQTVWIIKLRSDTHALHRPQQKSDAAAPGPFADLSPDSITGRYNWMEDGKQSGEVVLFPDHSVSNWRGEKKPSYKWDLQPDGLMITWLKGYNWFPRLAGPGIYEGFRDGHPVRIEKQQ